VGLEWGPLSLVSTNEELLGRYSSGSGLEKREYGHGDPLHWPLNTLYLQKLTLTSPTSGGRSVGIVHLRTKAMEFVCFVAPLLKFRISTTWYKIMKQKSLRDQLSQLIYFHLYTHHLQKNQLLAQGSLNLLSTEYLNCFYLHLVGLNHHF
jgi:hypothetical protein